MVLFEIVSTPTSRDYYMSKKHFDKNELVRDEEAKVILTTELEGIPLLYVESFSEPDSSGKQQQYVHLLNGEIAIVMRETTFLKWSRRVL